MTRNFRELDFFFSLLGCSVVRVPSLRPRLLFYSLFSQKKLFILIGIETRIFRELGCFTILGCTAVRVLRLRPHLLFHSLFSQKISFILTGIQTRIVRELSCFSLLGWSVVRVSRLCPHLLFHSLFSQKKFIYSYRDPYEKFSRIGLFFSIRVQCGKGFPSPPPISFSILIKKFIYSYRDPYENFSRIGLFFSIREQYGKGFPSLSLTPISFSNLTKIFIYSYRDPYENFSRIWLFFSIRVKCGKGHGKCNPCTQSYLANGEKSLSTLSFNVYMICDGSKTTFLLIIGGIIQYLTIKFDF